MVELGMFRMNTQEIMVSDPAYSVGSWCQGVVKYAVKGDWRVFHGSREGQVVFRIVHEETSPGVECLLDPSVDLRVESGFCGFSDIVAFRNNDLVPDSYRTEVHEENWQNMLLAANPHVVGPFGAYCKASTASVPACYVARNRQGLVVAVELLLSAA